ncbi:MAG TPA: alcohol dehydrogenase, partial [Dehalococcoidia bacterium]|nr:alcohol dehydrogenase [Dehalococcoidia bacterium]
MRMMQLDQSEPKTGEVRVKMSAAGICASDHHVMTGDNPTPMPIVLGHEGSGVIEAVGTGVSSVKVGDRCVLSFVPNCGHCRSCRQGLSNICDTNRLTGTRQYDGGFRLHTDEGVEVHQFAKLGVFAESIVVPQQACYPMPDDVPMEVGALIGCSVTTGVGGVINQPGMRAGMTVAVIGAGGVGLNAIQGAKLVNAAKIIAVDIHDHKLEFAYKFGATDVINSKDQDPIAAIQELTDDGVDFAFDTFGHKITTEQAYKATRKG